MGSTLVDFGDVRPRDEAWTTNGLFIGSIIPSIVSLQGELRGDNLPDEVDPISWTGLVQN